MVDAERPSAEDASLVAATLAGDLTAYEALYRRHAASVRAVARSNTSDPEAVSDAVQEAFLRALEKLPTLREPALFRPWVSAIARHAVRDGHRRAERSPVVPGEGIERADDALTPDDLAELAELATLVRSGVNELSPHDARALSMAVWLGLTPTEIARRLGSEPGAVKVRLHRARRRLREALAAEVLVKHRSGCAELGQLRDATSKAVAASRHVAGCLACQDIAQAELLAFHAGGASAGPTVTVRPPDTPALRRPLPTFMAVGRECRGVDDNHRILIDDPVVSRHHLELRTDPVTSETLATDLSANGTMLNDIRMDRARPVALRPGDVLTVGSVRLDYDGSPAARAATARTTLPVTSTLRVAVAVADLVGSTELAERVPAAQVADALDALYGSLRDVLRVCQGSVFNYVGDALLAVWDLDAQPAAADLALQFCELGLARVKLVAERLGVRDRDGAALRMGFGLGAGPAAVGTMSGAIATVIGDQVNVAFRLAGLAARDGHAEGLASSSFVAQLAVDHTVGPPQVFEVRGRQQPETAHAVRTLLS